MESRPLRPGGSGAVAVIRVRALWDDLTHGQRWTAGLALLLALALASFGLPRRTIVSSLAAPLGATAGAATRRPASAPATLSGPGSAVATVPAPLAGAGGVGPEPTAGPATLSASGSSPSPRVVVLVRSGDDPLPDRDDAAVAAVFLAQAPFHATVLTVDQDPTLCARIVAAGEVVMAGAGLDPGLVACLAGAGRTVLSYDERGGTPSGLLVSTRRDVTTGLVQAAVLARSAGGLTGKVGLVAAADLRPQVDAALPVLRSHGVPVADVAYLNEEPSLLTDVANGVRRFSAANVATVIFAASVDQQNAWAAQEAVLAPSVRYVVADGRDAVTNEAYGPTFDGALAVTSVRVPWFARAHGETTEQRACHDEFVAHEQFAVDLTATELVRVFMWCEHVGLLGRALAVAASGTPLGDALRRGALSPLTSDLGATATGQYGPVQDAVLRWVASCRCWTEVRPFRDVAA
ncbi:MAG: hypothetical protein JWO37_3738 [Acidimicrobiales bacterium]|jgi:hypothetical protein|nr:hypothetical protein [Acidimicrobiales bacterium]